MTAWLPCSEGGSGPSLEVAPALLAHALVCLQPREACWSCPLVVLGLRLLARRGDRSGLPMLPQQPKALGDARIRAEPTGSLKQQPGGQHLAGHVGPREQRTDVQALLGRLCLWSGRQGRVCPPPGLPALGLYLRPANHSGEQAQPGPNLGTEHTWHPGPARLGALCGPWVRPVARAAPVLTAAPCCGSVFLKGPFPRV